MDGEKADEIEEFRFQSNNDLTDLIGGFEIIENNFRKIVTS